MRLKKLTLLGYESKLPPPAEIKTAFSEPLRPHSLAAPEVEPLNASCCLKFSQTLRAFLTAPSGGNMSGIPNARFAGLAGYVTPTDRFRHAIVASKEGRVFEIFFHPLQGKGQSYFGAFPSLAGIGGFFSPDDNFQHILVGRTDGFIEEIFFKPGQIGFATPIARIGGIVGLDAFFTDDDRLRHVVMATNNGFITEIVYGPAIGSQIGPPLASFANIVGIAGFYTPDDRFRHVIVATADGRLSEVYYHPTFGKGIAPLVQLSDIAAISGFYTADDRVRRVLVVRKNGDVIEIYYHPSFGVKIAPLLKNIPGANGAAGFFTADDGFRHALVSTNSGDVSEIRYSPIITAPVFTSLGRFDPTPPQVVELGPDSRTITQFATNGLQWETPAGQCLRLAGTKETLRCCHCERRLEVDERWTVGAPPRLTRTRTICTTA